MKLNCYCNYCQNNGYVWLLKNNMVWVEIPKNASYNLKKYVLNFNSQSIQSEPNALLSKINNIDLNIHKRGFIILRNPIDRFKSLLSHYFIPGSNVGRVEEGKLWLNDLGIYNYNNNNIADIIFSVWDRIETIADPHHFNSQSSFIPPQFFEINNHMVYNVNELSLIFGLQTNINPSNSSNIFISDRNLKKISDIYKDDVNLYKKYFNYKYEGQ